MRRVETYGETLFDKVGRPIIVSQGREFVSGQVWDPRCLEDDIVQVKEENEREPRGDLFRIDICSWVLCGTGFNYGLGNKQCIRTHLGVERNILSWDERWNNDSGKGQD